MFERDEMRFCLALSLALVFAACGSTAGSGDGGAGPGADGGGDSDSDADSDSDTDTDGGCSENHPDRTMGLIQCQPGAEEGYTLLAPAQSTTAYLIDLRGRVVHRWECAYRAGLATYLLEDGNLLRTANVNNATFHSSGGAGGLIQVIDWDGTVVWEFEHSDESRVTHHDVEMMPGGNLLVVAWEAHPRQEALAKGRDPDALPDNLDQWSGVILEVAPDGAGGGEVVWEWHLWDHLVQQLDPTKEGYGALADHPGLADINGGRASTADLSHINSVDYHGALDQIALSSKSFGELWIIDHGTTTEEAAGHTGGARGVGGDLLYRWGNPQKYGAGAAEDQRLFGQHDVQWIDEGLPGAGQLLAFNNGKGRPGGDTSTVDQLVPAADAQGDYPLAGGEPFGPDELSWVYPASPDPEFYSVRISSAQRLAGGNTFVCQGQQGRLFEVTPEGELVWEYLSPVTADGPLTQGEEIPAAPGDDGLLNAVFKARRYAPDFPGLAGRDLTPGDYVELPAD